MPAVRRFTSPSSLPVWALILTSSVSAAAAQSADLSRLVVVGDSISAGVQNISLLGTQQVNGYASLIAKQAGVPLVLPLIASPGLPNALRIAGFNPLPVIQASPGTLPAEARLYPFDQPTNLSEPGTTVAGSLLPPANLPPPVGTWAKFVLKSQAYPDTPLSEVQEAVALHPTTLIVWLGSNDALVPALAGDLTRLTPVTRNDTPNPSPLANFTDAFNIVIGSLAPTGATMIVANLPDVTEVPFFTSIPTIAKATFRSNASVAAALGTGTGDYLRTGALNLALDILVGKTRGPLPALCPSPYPGLPTDSSPCVLTAADAANIRSHVNSYNAVIAAAVASLNAAKPNSAILVDIHALVDDIYANGYALPGNDVNAGILGGLFSADNIHPTNTGYAVIANQFIRTMNSQLNTRIPLVDVNKVAKADPLVFNKGILQKLLDWLF